MDTRINWQEDYWLMLAGPAHGNAANPRFLHLLAALDEGWEITLPVYRRPRWLDDRELVYHFILNHTEHKGTRLITVPADETVGEFVRERQLPTA